MKRSGGDVGRRGTMKSDVPFNSLKTSERTGSMSDVIGLCCRCGLIYFDVFAQFPRDLQWLFIERDLKTNIPSDEQVRCVLIHLDVLSPPSITHRN